MPTIEEIDDLLENPSAGLRKRKRKKQAAAPIDIDPEEESSLLANLGSGAMSGLSFVGGQLDKFTGSRALRGLLGGKPRELASIVPFSDTMGLTSRDDITSGNELLGNPEDTSLFSPEGAAGFAVEALLDPTLPFTGFLKGGLSGAGKLAKSAGVLDDAVRGVTKASKAAGKFMGPRVGKMYGTIGKHLDDLDPLARVDAEKALTTANKGKALSRELLDAPLGGNLSFGIPFMDEPLGVVGKAGGIGEKVAGAMDFVGDKLRYGNIPGTGYSPGRHFARLFNSTSGQMGTKEFQQAAQDVYRKTSKAEGDASMPTLMATQEEVDNPLYDPKKFIAEAEGLSPSTDYSHLIDPIRKKKDELYDYLVKTGAAPPRMLDDPYIPPEKHFPRRGNFPKDADNLDKIEKRFYDPTTGASRGRGDELKGMMRGTNQLDEMIYDPAVVAAKSKDDIADALNTQWAWHAMPTHTPEMIDELAGDILAFRKSHADELKAGLKPNFYKDPIIAAHESNLAMGKAKGATEGFYTALADTIKGHKFKPGDESVTLGKTLGDSGFHMGDGEKGALAETAKRLGLPAFDGKAVKSRLDPLVQAGQITQAQADKNYRAEFKKWSDGITEMPVSKQHYADAIRIKKLFDSPEEVSQLGKAIESLNHVFKAGVLAWPAFHTRNVTGSVVQNAAIGEFRPWAYKMTEDFVKGKPIDALKFPFVKQLLDDQNLPHTPENANKVFRARLAAAKIISPGTGVMAQGTTNTRGIGSLEELAREIPGRNPMGLGAAVKSAKQGNWNPLGIRGVMDKKGVPRETTTFAPLRFNEAAGNYADAFTRLPPMLSMLERGVDFDEALGRTLAAQADYASRAYTPFEQQLIKKWVPFYSFTRKMLPFVMDQLANAPSGRLAQVVRGQARMRDEEQFVPSHIAQTAAMPLPGAPEGFQRYLSSAGLMHEDPLNLLRPGQTAYKTVSGTLEELAGRLNPLAKAPLELAAGKQLYSGRDLQDLEGNLGRIGANLTGAKEAYDTPLLLEQLLSNSPASRLATTVRTLTDPRKGLGAKAANLGTGFRVTDVDVEKGKNVAMREALEDLLRGKTGIRQLRPHLYSKEEDLQNLSPDDKLALSLYKRLASEATKRARQAKPSKKNKKEKDK